MILFSACSLDGFIARRDGSIDWLFTDADYNYTPFYENVEVVAMGRVTYETALSFGGYVYSGKRAVVFSRTRDGARDIHRTHGREDTVEFTGRNPASVIEALKREPGRGSIWLVGGAAVTQPVLEAGLIDRHIVSIHPRLLGEGLPLYPRCSREQPLVLERSESFPSGLVQLTYRKP